MYFVVEMVNVLQRRYKEILQRKGLGIKLNWLQPLEKHQIEVLKSLDSKSKVGI
jgi:hypothetical protein